MPQICEFLLFSDWNHDMTDVEEKKKKQKKKKTTAEKNAELDATGGQIVNEAESAADFEARLLRGEVDPNDESSDESSVEDDEDWSDGDDFGLNDKSVSENGKLCDD